MKKILHFVLVVFLVFAVAAILNTEQMTAKNIVAVPSAPQMGIGITKVADNSGVEAQCAIMGSTCAGENMNASLCVAVWIRDGEAMENILPIFTNIENGAISARFGLQGADNQGHIYYCDCSTYIGRFRTAAATTAESRMILKI